MNRIKIIVIFIILILNINCGKTNTKNVYATLDGISIMNENEAYVIIDMYVVDAGAASFGIPAQTGEGDEKREGTYLGKVNFQDNTTKVIKKCGKYCSKIVCKNNIISLSVSELRAIQFLKADNYEIIKTVQDGGYLFDFTNDTNKMIIAYWDIYEYNDITKLKTILKPFPNKFRDAKYCPTDETVIAYIGASNTADNLTGDIYLINNDATGNTLVLSGYNAIKLCWHPDGNKIIFINENGIYSVEKDGSNVLFLKNLILPSAYYLLDIYFNLYAYVYYDTSGNESIFNTNFKAEIKTIKF